MRNFLFKIRWSIRTIFKDILYIFKSAGFSKHLGRPLSFFFATPIKYQWEKILTYDNRSEFSKDGENKKILLAPIYGFFDAQLGVETAIGKNLQLRGANVKILTCGATLPACQVNIAGNNNPVFNENLEKKFAYNQADVCKTCVRNLKGVSDSAELPQLKLKDFAKENDLEKATAFLSSRDISFEQKIIYKQINISEHAKSTTLRVLLRGTLEDNPYCKAVYRRFLLSAIIYIDTLERAFEEFRPDSILAVHGIYLEHGIITDLAKRDNINMVIWGIPYRLGALIASLNDTYHRQYIEESDEVWDQQQLNESQINMVQEYIGSKISGGRDNVNYHPNPILDKKKILSSLGFDSNKPLVSIFTNVLWDAQIFYSSNIFDGLLEWINETISFYVQNTDIQLAVRIHPAESKGGFFTTQPLATEIYKVFPSLPSNIKIIEPESDISSIILSDASSVSVVYGSNIALEIALRPNPLVIVGEAYSKGKGFSIDPPTKEDYFKILADPSSVKKNTQEQVAKAQRYAYHYYFKRMFNFKSITTPISGKGLTRNVILNFDNVDALMDGSDTGLKLMTDLLLGASDVYYQE